MFYKAKQLFEDAKNYINPQKDPVMWDLVNGLAELARSMRSLEETVDEIDRRVKQLRT